MKSVSLLFSILLFPLLLVAQDILVFRNGDEVKAKVEEIGPTEVSYKKFDNLNGVLYKVLKAELFMVKFENGSREVFAKTYEPTKQTTYTPAPVDQKITFNRWRFRSQGESLRFNEVDELMRKSKSKEANNTYKVARSLYSGSKPTMIIGMIAGIVGVTIGGLSTLLYVASYNDPFFKTPMYAGWTVGIIGWATFSYGVTLKSGAKEGFKKSVDQYNAVF